MSSISTSETPASEHVVKLDSLRRNRYTNGHERWAILRLFFGLKKEADDSNRTSMQHVISDARTRTAELLGRSQRTVASIVAGWRRIIRETDIFRLHNPEIGNRNRSEWKTLAKWFTLSVTLCVKSD